MVEGFEETPSNVPGVLAGSIFAFLTSAGYLASYYKYFGSMSEFDELKALHDAAGATDVVSAENMIMIGLAGGGIGLLASLTGCIAKAAGAKPIAAVYLLLLLVGSVLMIVGPILFSSAPTTIWDMLEPHPLTASPRLTDTQQGITDLSSILYNTCCEPYTGNPAEHQEEVPACDDVTDSKVCGLPTLLTAINQQDIQELVPKLCTCHKIENYGETPAKGALNVAVAEEGVCDSLKTIKVDISQDTLIPTTTFTLAFAIGLTPYSAFVSKLNFMRLIGDPRPPTYEYEDTNGDTQVIDESEAYGCGLGFAKGLSWTQFLFLDQIIAGPTIAGYICGGVNVLIVGLTIIYWLMPEENTQQEFMAYNPKA